MKRKELQYRAVKPILRSTLERLMGIEEFTPFRLVGGTSLRMATVDDIVAMKIDVISRGSRKNDFWDIHMLSKYYTIEQMLSLYEGRYPYGTTKEEYIAGLTNFSVADYDPNPICLQSKVWQLIKLDFTEWVPVLK